MAEEKLFSAAPREFAQERARKTFEALVSSAEECFCESGFDTTQTPDIASRAGVSVGTFYRYFADKREVLLEVLRRHYQQGVTEVTAGLRPELFAGGGAKGAIEAGLGVMMRYAESKPRLERVIAEMSLRDDKVAEFRQQFEDEGKRQLSELIRVACSRELVPDPEATAFVIHAGTVEIACILAGARGSTPMDRERTLSALAALLVQGLFPHE